MKSGNGQDKNDLTKDELIQFVCYWLDDEENYHIADQSPERPIRRELQSDAEDYFGQPLTNDQLNLICYEVSLRVTR